MASNVMFWHPVVTSGWQAYLLPWPFPFFWVLFILGVFQFRNGSEWPRLLPWWAGLRLFFSGMDVALNKPWPVDSGPGFSQPPFHSWESLSQPWLHAWGFWLLSPWEWNSWPPLFVSNSAVSGLPLRLGLFPGHQDVDLALRPVVVWLSSSYFTNI